MSDNPADSLRRELEAKLPIYHISRIWPLIEAALEARDAAAQADERERIGDLIDSLVVRHHDKSKELLMESVRDRCAELARSAVSDGN